MSVVQKTGNVLIRRKNHMKSLTIRYPRIDAQDSILADLLNLSHVDMKIELPVITADTRGIELQLPDFLSGMFYLHIRDGEKSFTERIALQ